MLLKGLGRAGGSGSHILRAQHWPGNLNLQIGNLTPHHVRELIRAGWEIDAHTFTHPDLTTVGPTRLAARGHDVRVVCAWPSEREHAK